MFEPAKEGVKVTLTIEYTFEENISQKITNQLILDKFNQKAVEEVLENLKTQLET